MTDLPRTETYSSGPAYIWSTSLPAHIRTQSLRQISQVSGPRNTLDFLEQTQKYISNITQQSLYTATSAQTSPVPVMRRKRKKTREQGRKSTESLPLMRDAGSSYKVTKYVLARPLSPRLLPKLTERPKPSARLFTNHKIETFLNRFEAKSRLPGLTLDLR